ncbi:MAG: O-methyltransferase [Taibaiella sp.]|nr:O-methyltransferase [Taibaiella sp.]
MISKMIRPGIILEIGTYTGYSAICLAQGLQPEGRLITIDNDAKWQDIRDKYWQQSGLNHQIEQIIGSGISVLNGLDISPDLVFIDADKKNYWNYLQLILPKMQAGGIILVDNVLFHGEVVMPEEQLHGAAYYIHEFNKKTLDEPRIEKLVLPIRDGISIFRVK